MANVVSTAGEEPVLVVAKFLAELAWADAGEEVSGPAVAGSVSEAGSLLASNRVEELLKLLLISADTVLPKISAQDFECVLSVLVNLVPCAASPAELQSSALLLSSKLASLNVDFPALKLKLLFLLHNVVPASNVARFHVLLHIIKAASGGGAEGRLGEAVLPNLRRLELQRQPWWQSLDAAKKRELYSALTHMIRDHCKGKAQKEAAAFGVKYLALFTAEEAAESEAVRDAAAAAALDFIRTPDAFHSDLLDIPAVHALEKSQAPQHRALFQLLTIFLTGRLSQFSAFCSANPSALQNLGLDADACETKMRLLSLASAAADSLSAASAAAAAAAGADATRASAVAASAATPPAAPGVGEIRYAILQDMLQVKDEFEVERWVVRAISAGLIDAKMDQLRHTVIVSRASYRVFGPQQWQELRSRLLSWKENVGSISKVAHQAGSATSAAAAAAVAAPAQPSASAVQA